MSETKNNLNALLARLRNNSTSKDNQNTNTNLAKREKNKSPSLHPVDQQSAFNEENNISNIMKDNNNNKGNDDSEFKEINLNDRQFSNNNNDAFVAPSFRPELKDDTQMKNNNNNNFRQQVTSEPIVNNSLVNDNQSIAFDMNNNLKNEFDAMKMSSDMVNFDIKASYGNFKPNNNNTNYKNAYDLLEKPNVKQQSSQQQSNFNINNKQQQQNNNKNIDKESFEIEEIEDLEGDINNNQIKYKNQQEVPLGNQMKNNNFLGNNNPNPQQQQQKAFPNDVNNKNQPKNSNNNNNTNNNNSNKYSVKNEFELFNNLGVESSNNNDFRSKNIAESTKPSQKTTQKQQVQNFNNDFEVDNKSIPSHIDAFNNMKNMQKLNPRENFQSIQNDIEKKNSQNNMSIQNEILEKKQKIANEYQSKLNNMKADEILDSEPSKNNFFAKSKLTSGNPDLNGK